MYPEHAGASETARAQESEASTGQDRRPERGISGAETPGQIEAKRSDEDEWMRGPHQTQSSAAGNQGTCSANDCTNAVPNADQF